MTLGCPTPIVVRSFVHLMIEVLVRCCFEHLEFILYNGKIIAATKLFAEAIDFAGLIWVAHRLKLLLVTVGQRGCSLHRLRLLLVVALLLI